MYEPFHDTYFTSCMHYTWHFGQAPEAIGKSNTISQAQAVLHGTAEQQTALRFVVLMVSRETQQSVHPASTLQAAFHQERQTLW